MKKTIALTLALAALPASACEQKANAHNYDQDPPGHESKLIVGLVSSAQKLASKATAITSTVLMKAKDVSGQTIAAASPYDADPRPIQEVNAPSNTESRIQEQAPN